MKRFLVFLAGMMCFSLVCFADKSGSLTVSPGQDVSWSCSLRPYETANLTITIAPAPKGYRLKLTSPKVDITRSNPDFIWGGGYSVANTVLTSATTRVTVSCEWEPIPPEGEGGGAGAPPPNLYGSATGIAVAQPGEYWNVADAPVIAVGNSVTVNAYKNEGEPAPSSWSISGPATISGAGASATVTGTAPSANEYDVIVHSVCNETGQSDDELLTVVGVTSIEAEPDIVCVGEEDISYTITTQPEGYNYMVSYTPADTSTPGIKEVIATCGTSAATCTVTVIKVEIEEDSINTSGTSQEAAVLNLTDDTYCGDGGVMWESTPSGLGGVIHAENSFVFNPSISSPGTYTVKAYAKDLITCDDEATVHVVIAEFPDPLIVCEECDGALSVVVTPAVAASAVTFDTADTDIATVSGTAPTLTVSGQSVGTTTIRAYVEYDGNNQQCGEYDVKITDRVSGDVAVEYIAPAENEMVPTGVIYRHSGDFAWSVTLCDGAPPTTVKVTYHHFVEGKIDLTVADSYNLSSPGDTHKELATTHPCWADKTYDASDVGEHTGVMTVKWEAMCAGCDDEAEGLDSNTFTVFEP